MSKIRTESKTELLKDVVTESFIIPGSEWFKIVSNKLTIENDPKEMSSFINPILTRFQLLNTVLLFNCKNWSRE